jgi:hypothetical protein
MVGRLSSQRSMRSGFDEGNATDTSLNGADFILIALINFVVTLIAVFIGHRLP